LRTCLCAPSPSHCATTHATHSSGEESMWFPHRMSRRRSHTFSLNESKRESHLLSEKKAKFSNTGNPPPRHQEKSTGAQRREGRARVPELAGRGHPNPLWLGALCTTGDKNRPRTPGNPAASPHGPAGDAVVFFPFQPDWVPSSLPLVSCLCAAVARSWR
jgi:hypothetical protein